jgi:peptidoglycan/LPS O-acetylase OafA/YrhL
MYLAARSCTLVGVHTGETWRLGRRPALDGLRGVAVLLVMAGHAWPAHSQIAMAGVGVFFTLSGFLITSLLLEENARRGTVSLRRFYARRALRLMPASVTFLLVALLLGWVVWPQTVPVLVYVQNWAVIGGVPGGAVLHFWSLAVEEQFYLVWPAVLMLVVRIGRRPALWLTVAGAVGSAVLGRALIADHASAYRVAYGSDTNAVALLAGCALALVLAGSPARRRRPVLVAAAGVGLVGLMLAHTAWQLTLVPLLTVAAIYGLCAGNTTPAWLAPRWVTLVGERSYALYIWSTPLAFDLFLNPLREQVGDLVAVGLYVAASWAVAAASWYLVERPFLQLKDRQVIRSNVTHAGIELSRVVDPEPATLK